MPKRPSGPTISEAERIARGQEAIRQRVSTGTRAALDQLASALGVSKGAALELAIRFALAIGLKPKTAGK